MLFCRRFILSFHIIYNIDAKTVLSANKNSGKIFVEKNMFYNILISRIVV